MMLADHYGPNRFGLSFELFPPKTPEGDAALLRHVEKLKQFDPAFFTCTYGAGGSTRDKTLEVVQQVKELYKTPVASHLTCVGATVDELRDYLTTAAQRSIDYVVALRGDPPSGQTEFVATKGGLRYANELVSLVRAEFPDFGIAVAGYPEVHQEAPSADIDLENLKRKVDCGADIVITQLFYNNSDFFEFRDRYEKAGIKAPLVPGILPVTNLKQIQRITDLCAAKLPAGFVARLGESADAQWQAEIGIEQASSQVNELLATGVSGLHFYVLNKSRATSRVLANVDLPSRV